MKKICEVCGNKSLKSVLDLGQNPLCDDLIKIGNIKNSCGISIDFSSDPNSIVNLKERIEDNLKEKGYLQFLFDTKWGYS